MVLAFTLILKEFVFFFPEMNYDKFLNICTNKIMKEMFLCKFTKATVNDVWIFLFGK